MNEAASRLDDVRIWHEVEHSSYAADLAVFTDLAGRLGDPVVDLGAGTGRVSFHLAAHGFRVVAVEREPVLALAVAEQAAERSLPVEAVTADARQLHLREKVPLVIAPMQFMHIAGGPAGRGAVLRSVAAALTPGGTFAAAVLNTGLPRGSWTPDPIPDVREVGGWIHSSLPTEIEVGESTIALRRLRQIVGPDGSLEEAVDVTLLDRLTPADLEREAATAGLIATAVEPLPRSAEHEDSVVMLMVNEGAPGTDG